MSKIGFLLGRQGDGMFLKRRILALEQDSAMAKIRSERSHGWRSERKLKEYPVSLPEDARKQPDMAICVLSAVNG